MDMHQPVEVPKQTRAAIEQSMQAGLTPGAQVCIRRGGRIVGELAIGEARPGVAMTADTLLPWMSMTKPVVAAAVMQQIERGRLGLEDPVAQHIPEFSAAGKGDITILHLLTHTAGLRKSLHLESGKTWEQIIQEICQAPAEADWPAGRKAGYHVSSSWYLLGEIVRRVDGRMIDAYVRQEIFEPLGMSDCWLAMDVQQQAAYGDRIGLMYKTGTSRIELNAGSGSPQELARIRPGASGRGPARQLSRFFQMLLDGGELEGRRVLSAESVQAMTARQRVGMVDQTFGHVMDWGLGLILNSAEYRDLATLPYNFGPGASRDTFGHGGAQSSIAFADPQQNIVVVIILNGQPGEPKHHQRMTPILAGVWEDIAAMA